MLCETVIFLIFDYRLEELSGSEENLDCEEVELIQHISLDINGLNRLFNGQKERGMKKLSLALFSWIHSLFHFFHRNCNEVQSTEKNRTRFVD